MCLLCRFGWVCGYPILTQPISIQRQSALFRHSRLNGLRLIRLLRRDTAIFLHLSALITQQKLSVGFKQFLCRMSGLRATFASSVMFGMVEDHALKRTAIGRRRHKAPLRGAKNRFQFLVFGSSARREPSGLSSISAGVEFFRVSIIFYSYLAVRRIAITEMSSSNCPRQNAETR